MEPISESVIKKVALRFFRNHYKFRLRREDQPAIAKYDLEAEGGILADGYYSFKKNDGSTFTATFEATSLASKKEVLFHPQQMIRLWDSVAFAAFATTLLVVLNYFFSFHNLDERSIFIRLVLIISAFTLSYLGFFLWSGNRSRYRYIYAIEQFKKYHADEQWIALAFDVFESSEETYYKELRNQCVLNGFGLLLVENNLNTRIVITPSRHDVFKGKRRVIDFFAGTKKARDIGMNLLAPIGEFLGLSLGGKKTKKDAVARFSKSYYNQIGFAVCCFLLVTVVFWKEMQMVEFKSVEPEVYVTTLAKSQSNNVREQEEYLGDSASTSKRKNASGNFWLKPAATIDEIKLTEAQKPAEAEKPRDKLVRREGERFHIYDCSRYSATPGTFFLITEGEYATLFHTKTRLQQLYDKGVESGAIRQNCLSGRKPGFLVYLGSMFENEAEARKIRTEFLKSKDFKAQTLKIISFQPQGR